MRTMNGSPSLVDERRAAVLTGLSLVKLRFLSKQAGLGRPLGNSAEQTAYTYDELRRLCLLAAHSEK